MTFQEVIRTWLYKSFFKGVNVCCGGDDSFGLRFDGESQHFCHVDLNGIKYRERFWDLKMADPEFFNKLHGVLVEIIKCER